MPANCFVVLYGSCGSLYAAVDGVGREIQMEGINLIRITQ
jgi:hypothetical protein